MVSLSEGNQTPGLGFSSDTSLVSLYLGPSFSQVGPCLASPIPSLPEARSSYLILYVPENSLSITSYQVYSSMSPRHGECLFPPHITGHFIRLLLLWLAPLTAFPQVSSHRLPLPSPWRLLPSPTLARAKARERLDQGSGFQPAFPLAVQLILHMNFQVESLNTKQNNKKEAYFS